MNTEIALALIAQAGVIVSALIAQGRKITRIENNSAVTRAQTENDHRESEFPNLRDEITETRGLIHGLIRQFGGLEMWVKDLAANATRLDDTISRKALIAARDLTDFKEEREQRLSRMLTHDIPVLVRKEIEDYSSRTPPTGT